MVYQITVRTYKTHDESVAVSYSPEGFKRPGHAALPSPDFGQRREDCPGQRRSSKGVVRDSTTGKQIGFYEDKANFHVHNPVHPGYEFLMEARESGVSQEFTSRTQQ